MIMSNLEERESNNAGAKSVEGVIEYLQSSGLPIKSITAVHDVVAGVILGGVGDVDHEQELAAGVSYVVIGLGKLPTNLPPGINFVENTK
jgi:hypothetical protein